VAQSCDPSDLAAASKCFCGLSDRELLEVQTYLLAVIAGGSTDPSALAASAKAFGGLPDGVLTQVQAYLACQIAG
jgi:hypothetical protein